MIHTTLILFKKIDHSKQNNTYCFFEERKSRKRLDKKLRCKGIMGCWWKDLMTLQIYEELWYESYQNVFYSPWSYHKTRTTVLTKLSISFFQSVFQLTLLQIKQLFTQSVQLIWLWDPEQITPKPRSIDRKREKSRPVCGNIPPHFSWWGKFPPPPSKRPLSHKRKKEERCLML